MPDHFQTIYAERAADYERLVQREDYQGHLTAALRRIAQMDGAAIADMGAGTGRMTRIAATDAATVVAMDASVHMLREATESIRKMGLTNCRFVVADNRQLPLVSASVDGAFEGWSFGHLTGWYPDTWRIEMQRALGEMKRITKPGGVNILMETLGTGRETPLAPTPALADLYNWLVSDLGFQAEVLRTDYRFESPDEAVELSTFFFGEAMIKHLQDGVILPECTGMWWRRV